MVEAVDGDVKVTIVPVEGTKTLRLTCGSCDWMETAGSPGAATRKKNNHVNEHRTAIHGIPEAPTIYDAIEGTDDVPEVKNAPVPVGDVAYLRALKEQAEAKGVVKEFAEIGEVISLSLDAKPNAFGESISVLGMVEQVEQRCQWCNEVHEGGPENCNDVGQLDQPFEPNAYLVEGPADPQVGDEVTVYPVHAMVVQEPPAWSDEDFHEGEPLPAWTDVNAPEVAPELAPSRHNPAVTLPTHTRTETDQGPDFCKECSDEAQEWIQWPCPSLKPAPDPLLVQALTMSRLHAQKGASDRDREAWLAERAQSVSATLAAKLGAASDLNYCITEQVREKIHGSTFNGNAYTAWGKEREPFLEQAGWIRHGIVGESHLFFHRENPRHSASPDGIAVNGVTGEVALGEYKTSGKELTWDKVVSNGYYDQVQWQLHVLEGSHCWLMWEWRRDHPNGGFYAEVGGEHLILRDQERIDELVRRADLFLEVLDAERDRMSSMAQAEETDEVDPELYTLVLLHLRAKDEQKRAEEHLRAYCEANGLKSLEIPGLAKVSYSFGSARSSFDREAFNTDHPGLYEQYVRPGSAPERPTLRVTAKGETDD